MKSIKIYANVANAVNVHITNNNAYSGKPFIRIEDTDGSILTFYSSEDYYAFKEYKREEQK